MSHGLLSAPVPFDVELGSLLLANMLADWLDNEVVAQGNREAAHEPSQLTFIYRSRPYLDEIDVFRKLVAGGVERPKLCAAWWSLYRTQTAPAIA